MALDGRNVAKTTVTLTVKGKKAGPIANIKGAYAALVKSPDAIEFICENDGIKDSGIAELISVAANTDSSTIGATTYVIADEESECAESMTILVLGADTDASSRLAGLLTEYIEQAQGNIVAEWGEHSLDVMSGRTFVGADYDVIYNQRLKNKTLSELYDAVAARKKGLTKEQLAYYESLNISEDVAAQPEDVKTQADIVSVLSSSVSAKFLLIGLFAGVFCMAGIWSAGYVMSSRIRAEDPIEKLFGVAVIGVIPSDREKKHVFGFVDRWIVSIRDRNKRIFSVEEAAALVVSRVKVQSAKDGVSKLVFVGCDIGKNMPVIPESMAGKLKEAGVDAVVLDNVLYDPENTEKLAEMEGAVIVEKAGRTLYSELAEEIEIVKRQQIKILGCVIVE